MLALTALLTIALLLALATIYAVKRQIRSLSRQLQERMDGGTGRRLTLPLWGRDILGLARTINCQLEQTAELQAEIIRANQELRETMANLSHDLRTPLTSVSGYLQSLEKGSLSDEQRELTAIALRKAASLQHLVDGFFELSLIADSETAPQWERLNLNNMVMDSIVENTSLFEAKQCVPCLCQPAGAVYVWADRKMLQRIIQNLLSNGICYGLGQLEVTIDGPGLKVANRVSVPESIDLDRIWDRFYTANPARSEGAGLGLSIVKLLAEKMKAVLKVELEDDVFSVSVRLQVPPKNSETGAEGLTPAGLEW